MPRKLNPDATKNSPRLHGARRDVYVVFKTTKELKATLRAEAEKFNRILSSEVEYRLKQSLLGGTT